MRRAFAAFAIWVGLVLVSCADGQELTVHLEPRKPAQPASGTYLIGVMAPSAGLALDAEWTDDVTQNERAYCAVRYSLTTFRFKGDTLYVVAVDSVIRAPVERGASPVGIIDARCPAGTPRLHTHPPSRCLNVGGELAPRWSCVKSEWQKTRCIPSLQDVRSLARQQWTRPFDIVMCGKGVFTFYAVGDTT